MRSRTQFGFTLLELLTAMTVLAILLGIGVPSFRDTVRNNRIASQSSALFTAMTLARSEASKRGVTVSVCSSGNQATCGMPVDWSQGWILFLDTNGNGLVDAPADTVLQVFPGLSGGVYLNPAPPAAVSFRSDGSIAGAAANFVMTHPDCTGQHARHIGISLRGSMRSEAVPCP